MHRHTLNIRELIDIQLIMKIEHIAVSIGRNFWNAKCRKKPAEKSSNTGYYFRILSANKVAHKRHTLQSDPVQDQETFPLWFYHVGTESCWFPHLLAMAAPAFCMYSFAPHNGRRQRRDLEYPIDFQRLYDIDVLIMGRLRGQTNKRRTASVVMTVIIVQHLVDGSYDADLTILSSTQKHLLVI